jgi:hypothetical protein
MVTNGGQANQLETGERSLFQGTYYQQLVQIHENNQSIITASNRIKFQIGPFRTQAKQRHSYSTLLHGAHPLQETGPINCSRKSPPVNSPSIITARKSQLLDPISSQLNAVQKIMIYCFKIH